MRISIIESSLLHDDVMSILIIFIDGNRWLRHYLVNDRREDRNISAGVSSHSLDETNISDRIKEFFQVLQADLNDIVHLNSLSVGSLLSIHDSLKLDHIFEFAVDWVLFRFVYRRILESRNEFLTFIYWYINIYKNWNF